MSRYNLVTHHRLFSLVQMTRANVHRHHRNDDEVWCYFSSEDFACEDSFLKGIWNKAIVAIVFHLVKSRTFYREIENVLSLNRFSCVFGTASESPDFSLTKLLSFLD